MKKLSNLEKAQLKDVALPIWKNIVEAASQRDYARFSRGFSSDLRARMSEQNFLQNCQEFPLLTTVNPDYEFIESIQRENGVTILWRLSSHQLKGEFLGLLSLHSGESGMEISGVWIS